MQRIMAVVVLLLWVGGMAAFIYYFYPRPHAVQVTRWVTQTKSSTYPGDDRPQNVSPVHEESVRVPSKYAQLHFVVMCIFTGIAGLIAVFVVVTYFIHDLRNTVSERQDRQFTAVTAFTFGVVGTLFAAFPHMPEEETPVPYTPELPAANSQFLPSPEPTIVPDPSYTPSEPTYVAPRDQPTFQPSPN